MSQANSRSFAALSQLSPALNSHAAVAANEMRRRIKHGRVRPMHDPTWLERLLGR